MTLLLWHFGWFTILAKPCIVEPLVEISLGAKDIAKQRQDLLAFFGLVGCEQLIGCSHTLGNDSIAFAVSQEGFLSRLQVSLSQHSPVFGITNNTTGFSCVGFFAGSRGRWLSILSEFNIC